MQVPIVLKFMSLSTPVAFIIFNRPNTTERVFEAIRKAKPLKLLVIADGPRIDRSDEVEKCTATRAIIDRVDWECEVMTHYSDINLGCKRRVSSGITWVFSQVEEAIILEDDCLPTASFFQFCQTLLEKYRYDDRISMIGGSNYQQKHSRTSDSYFFTKYAHIWGWATWRRAWKDYDVQIETWPECRQRNLLQAAFHDRYEQKAWVDAFDSVHAGKIDTWDYQWLYTCFAQSRLSIEPDLNLVSNIGFGVDATHTFGESPWANLPTQDIWQIEHPPIVTRNVEADLYTFNHHYGGNSMRQQDRLIPRIKNRLRPLKQLIPAFS
jgi:hypothetical protein